MRKILLVLGLLMFGAVDVVAIPIVASTDSITFTVKLTDSISNKVPFGDGDSVYWAVRNPSGATADIDSLRYPTANIDSAGLSARKSYVFHDLVSNLVSGGPNGIYTIEFITTDSTLGLDWGREYKFQLVNDPFAIMLDSVGLAAVDVAGLDGWDPLADSVNVDVSAAVASLLPNVIADSIWDAILTGATHNINNSAGRLLRELAKTGLIHTGTSDNVPTNTSNTISLETGGGTPTVSSVDDFYHGSRISISDGTGKDQAPRLIVDYTGSNQSATVSPAWNTTPDATSKYDITPAIVHAETSEGGYEGGAVWISPNGSTTALVNVDGTINNPIDDGSLANARIVANALNLAVFHLLPGASITLDENYDDWEFTGAGYTVALGGQSIASSFFIRGIISGIAVGASNVIFEECIVNDIETNLAAFLGCGLNGQIKMATTGAYRFHNCFSGNADGGTEITFGVSLTQTAVFQDFHGNITVDSMGEGVTDSFVIAGSGQVTFNASNIAGEAFVRGGIKVIDNSATINIDEDVAFTIQRVGQVAADSVWLSSLEDRDGTAGSFGDSAQGWSGTASAAVLAAGQFSKIGDSVWLRAFATVVGSYVDSMLLANELATKEELASETADSTLGHVDSAFSITTFYDKITNLESGLIASRGIITGTTPSVSGFSSSSLTQADNYWNDQMIMLVSGNAAGQAARTSDFTAATDSITVSPSFSVSPAQNDTFIIFGLVREAVGAGGGSDTTAIRAMMINNLDSMHIGIAAFTTDSVWQADSANHNSIAGSMGEAQDLSNFATAGTIADTFFAKDTGSAFSVAIGFGAFVKDSTTDGGGGGSDTTAIKEMMRGNNDMFSTDVPQNWVENGGFEDDTVGTTTAPNLWVQNTIGLWTSTSTQIRTTFSDGKWSYRIQTNTANDTLVLTQKIGVPDAGWYMWGFSYQSTISSAGFAILSSEAEPYQSGFKDSMILAASASRQHRSKATYLDGSDTALYISFELDGVAGATFIEIDDIFFIPGTDTVSTPVAGSGSDGLDTLNELYSERLVEKIDSQLTADHGSGSWTTASLSGSGGGTVVVGATDTSGTDTLVSKITIVMKDLAGNPIGQSQTTNSSGFTTWNLDVGDSVTVETNSRTQNNHIWPAGKDTIVIVTDPDSFFVANGDSILMGFDFAFPTNSTPNTATVFGDLVDISGSPDQYVKVYAQLSQSGLATDDSNTVSMIVDSTITDSVGRWTMVLLWSSTVDSTKYNMWFENNGIASKKRQVFVEDGTLQRVTLGKD